MVLAQTITLPGVLGPQGQWSCRQVCSPPAQIRGDRTSLGGSEGSVHPELEVLLAGLSLQGKRCFALDVVLLSPFFIHSSMVHCSPYLSPQVEFLDITPFCCLYLQMHSSFLDQPGKMDRFYSVFNPRGSLFSFLHLVVEVKIDVWAGWDPPMVGQNIYH